MPPLKETKITRLQIFLDPLSGQFALQLFGSDIVQLEESNPVLASAQELFSTQYVSLQEADDRVKAFPGFAELAVDFADKPFSTLYSLLDALRQPVTSDGAISPDILPQPPQEPS